MRGDNGPICCFFTFLQVWIVYRKLILLLYEQFFNSGLLSGLLSGRITIEPG